VFLATQATLGNLIVFFNDVEKIAIENARLICGKTTAVGYRLDGDWFYLGKLICFLCAAAKHFLTSSFSRSPTDNPSQAPPIIKRVWSLVSLPREETIKQQPQSVSTSAGTTLIQAEPTVKSP